MKKIFKLNLKKNDLVSVLTGKDKGKQGKIERAYPKDGTVVVTGINLYKRHMKPRGESRVGEIVTLTKPLASNKVQLVCPKCSKVTRIGYLITGDKKVRVCKKCKKEI